MFAIIDIVKTKLGLVRDILKPDKFGRRGLAIGSVLSFLDPNRALGSLSDLSSFHWIFLLKSFNSPPQCNVDLTTTCFSLVV